MRSELVIISNMYNHKNMLKMYIMNRMLIISIKEYNNKELNILMDPQKLTPPSRSFIYTGLKLI